MQAPGEARALDAIAALLVLLPPELRPDAHFITFATAERLVEAEHDDDRDRLRADLAWCFRADSPAQLRRLRERAARTIAARREAQIERLRARRWRRAAR